MIYLLRYVQLRFYVDLLDLRFVVDLIDSLVGWTLLDGCSRCSHEPPVCSRYVGGAVGLTSLHETVRRELQRALPVPVQDGGDEPYPIVGQPSTFPQR